MQMIIKHIRYFCTVQTSRISILLYYQSPLAKYTFLNSRSSTVKLNIVLKTHNQFVDQMNKNMHIIKKLQTKSYNYNEIVEIQKKGTSDNLILRQHASTIKKISKLFDSLIKDLIQELNVNNLQTIMMFSENYEIIDIRIWQKIISIFKNNYSNFPIQKRNQILKYILQYLKTKFMGYYSWNNKFIYRQNCILDLGNLHNFVFILFQSYNQTQQFDSNFQQNFFLLIQLIDRLRKLTILRINQLINCYLKLEQKLLNKLQTRSIDYTLALYQLYGFLGILSNSRFGLLQKNLEGKILKKFQQNDISKNFETIIQIFSTWNLLSYKNQKFYTLYLRPYIIQNESQIKINSHYANLIYNIICCKIFDNQILKILSSKIIEKYPLENKMIHIVNHYIAIKQNKQHLSAYNCKQHSILKQIITTKIFSTCMSNFSNANENSSLKISFQQRQGIQSNAPEDFWLKILKKAHQKVSAKYPNSINQFYQNFSFCVFQNDAFMVVNNKGIAFQLSGTHYQLKNIDGFESLQGQNLMQAKKIIKYQIIKAYGIKILQVKTSDKAIQMIASLSDFQAGIKLLSEKIQAMIE